MPVINHNNLTRPNYGHFGPWTFRTRHFAPDFLVISDQILDISDHEMVTSDQKFLFNRPFIPFLYIFFLLFQGVITMFSYDKCNKYLTFFYFMIFKRHAEKTSPTRFSHFPTSLYIIVLIIHVKYLYHNSYMNFYTLFLYILYR
jgi:hypothetical protein